MSGVARFLKHFVVAVVISSGLFLAADLHGMWSIDEGLYLVQARQLATEDSWPVHYAGEEELGDSTLAAYANANASEKGVFSYVRHPLYPRVLAYLATDSSPTFMPYLLSLFGFFLCLIAVWMLCTRLAPGREPIAMWLAFTSPLLFHAFVIWAHSLAAAFFTFGLYFIFPAIRDKSLRLPAVLPSMVCFALVCLLRTEGKLAALAVAIAFIGYGVKRRLRPMWGAGVTVLVTTVGTHVVESWWIGRITGGGMRELHLIEEQGAYFAGRLTGMFNLFFEVTNLTFDRLALALVPGIALWIAFDIQRKRPEHRQLAGWLATGAAAVSVLGLWVLREDAREGFFAAWPLGFVAVGLVFQISKTEWRPYKAMALMFLIMIVLTQYSSAGGYEWGARYISLLVPLLCIGIAMQASSIFRMSSRFLWSTVIVVVCGAAAIGITNTSQRFTGPRDALSRFDETERLDLVLTDKPLLAITTWQEYPNWRWAYVPSWRLKSFLAESGNDVKTVVIARPGERVLTKLDYSERFRSGEREYLVVRD